MVATHHSSLLARLGKLLGGTGLLVPGSDDIERYIHEPRGRFTGRALAVIRPATTQEVAAVMAICREAGVAVVPQGGNTGLVGGQVVSMTGSEVILSLERMRAIREVDARGATLLAEAGCTLTQVQTAAEGAGLVFPLSLASEGSATIGGNIATNAGGNMTVRYGNMRRQVLGLEVVLADGSIYNGLRSLRKDNSGYDVNQLFIGSEGTLGIITAASLMLSPMPRQSLTALVGVERLADVPTLLELLRHHLGETISAFEFMPRLAMEYVLEYLEDAHDPLGRAHPWYAFVQADTAARGEWLGAACIEALDAASQQGIVTDVVVAGSDAQARALWRLRESVSPAQKVGGVSLKHDISVPVAAIPRFVEQAVAELEKAMPGIRPCIFGHIGDGNLHFNLSPPVDLAPEAFLQTEAVCNRIIFDLVDAHGGSIAAEHGIGQLRREELARRCDPVRLALMKQLKQCLDPDGLLNPGKIIDKT